MQPFQLLADELSTINWALDFVDMSRLEVDEYLFRAAFLKQLQLLPEAYDLPRSLLLKHGEYAGPRNNAVHLDRSQFLAKVRLWQVRRAERDARDNRY